MTTPTKNTLTKEQWQDIEKRLSGAWGNVELTIDGYAVTLQVEAIKARQYVIVVYVNGCWKGEWLKPGHEMQQRFYQVKSKALYSTATQKRAIKNCGKRWAQQHGLFNKYEYVVPDWKSFRLLKSHLLKNNQSIKLVTQLEPATE